MGVKVTELTIYPIKGCRAVPVKAARVKNTGFCLDRHWVVVSEDRGRFQTQRNEPRLALVDISLPLEAVTAEPTSLPKGACLTLSAPGQPELKVPLYPSNSIALQQKECIVWEWKGKAYDEGEEAAAWLSKYLGKPVRLLRYAGDEPSGSPDLQRPVDADFADGHFTAFADGFPFLLASQESLADLNTRLPEQIPMNRFRPNITVSGGKPWEEDLWEDLRIGELEMHSAKPCDRCKVTTTNQATAEVGKEPLRTLQGFRKGGDLGWSRLPSWKNGVFFGWNLVSHGEGIVTVGDTVSITQQREGAKGLL